MRYQTHLIAAVLVFAILSACGGTRPAGPTSQPLRLPPGKWTANLTQSGGFVSVLLTVEIPSDGRLAAADQRLGRTVAQTLPLHRWANFGA